MISVKILGIDTSNYTTSLAIVGEDGYRQQREILDVGENERGLRQSDALFLHTKNLPRLAELLGGENIDAVAYSARPRDVEGSYMPCFLAGECVARCIGALLDVPVLSFSHQAGHIEAAVRTCDGDVGGEFLAFHLSGGTTEVVHAKRRLEIGYESEIIGKTLDISAGQLIDRIGVLLGMKFPCGNELEALARSYVGKLPKMTFSIKDGCCNLSGMENKISAMIGKESREYIARYAIEYVGAVVCKMAIAAREKYPDLPFLFAGGVMRNEIIRKMITDNIQNVFFAKTELSSDNAVGTAYLGLRVLGGK